MSRGSKKKLAGKKSGVAGSQARDEQGRTNLVKPSTWQNWALGLLLVAGTIAVYLPVWRAGFIWDDDSILTKNRVVQADDGLWSIWFGTKLSDYFPLTYSVFWIEWRLLGMHATGYHVVNVLLHAGSAVLWWRVLERLKIPGAWLAAALFALHPVNVESVAWITELKNTLAMFFYAVAALWCVRFDDNDDKRRWYWLGLSAFVLSLLSKTVAVMFPFALLGMAWFRRGRITRKDILRSVPFFAVALVLGLVTMWFQSHRAINTDIVREDSFLTRLAGAGCAVWFYLYKAVLPLNLSFVYPRWQINPADLLVYVPGVLAVAGLFACWWNRNRPWGKALFAGLSYFVLMAFPTLGFLNVYFMRYSLVADHWQYFSIIGVVALAAAGIVTAFSIFAKPARGCQAAFCGILLLIFGTLTWRQTLAYNDIETLWKVTLAKNPDCSLAHTNYGNILARKGLLDQAFVHHETALKIRPDDAKAHLNFGNALLQKGNLDEAIVHYKKALALKPDLVGVDYNYGTALFKKGRIDEAIAHYELAVKSLPDSLEAWSNLGTCLMQRGRVEEAIASYRKALEISPNDAEIYFNLGDAFSKLGRLDEAIAHFKMALKFDPNYAQTYLGLGNAFFDQHRLDEAIASYKTALRLEPGRAEVRANLAIALDQAGRPDEAILQYREALAVQPDFLDVLKNLAWILATSPNTAARNGAEAVTLAQKANRLTGGQDVLVFRILAAANAEIGQFPEAVKNGRRALELAIAQNNQRLAEALRSEIESYEQGKQF